MMMMMVRAACGSGSLPWAGSRDAAHVWLSAVSATCSSVYGVLLGVRIWGEKGKIWIKKCRIMAVTIRG